MNHMSEHHCPAEDRDVPSPRVEHIPGAEADPDVSCPCLQCYILAEIGDERLDFPLVQPELRRCHSGHAGELRIPVRIPRRVWGCVGSRAD